jgi:hypothetical protein
MQEQQVREQIAQQIEALNLKPRSYNNKSEMISLEQVLDEVERISLGIQKLCASIARGQNDN